MGVPGFFAWLVRNYDQKKVILSELPDEARADYLFLDSNCFLHPQHFALLAFYEKTNKSMTRDQLVTKMINRCLSYLDFLADYVDPKVKVVVSIDGVAPMAKMSQQRVRRFKSMYDDKLKREIRANCKVTLANEWSNTVITPGTEDMERLHNAIIKHINTRKDMRFEYSSYHTQGEGEHKIMEEIRKFPKDKDIIIVIYGLDADLIFLSKALNRKHVYLLRESANLGKFGKRNKVNYDMTIDPVIEVEEELEYISIDATKDSLFALFTKMVSRQKEALKLTEDHINKDNVVNDFIVLCFLLGNDFLPHIPSIDISKGGLDLLFDGYIKTYIMLRTHLVNITPTIDINMIFFEELLKFLSKREDYYFQQLLPEHAEKSKNRRVPVCKTRCEQKIANLDAMVGFKSLPDPIRFGQGHPSQWKSRYYETYFNAPDHQDTLVNFLCKNYLDGLVWTLKYYFTGCQSWSWFYPRLHAPFVSDLYYFLKDTKFDMNKVEFEDLGPSKPFEQLLAVLPPTCYHLLPNSYQHLMQAGSPIEDFYPNEFEIDYHGKDIFWKCIPRITTVDVRRLRAATKDLKLNFTERKRNEPLDPIKNYKD